MPIELRTITADEALDYVRFVDRSFGEAVDDADLPLWEALVETDRMLVATEDGRWIGNAGAYSLHLTLPGGATVPMAGVTAVGVRPTHRRRGVLTRMMGAVLEQARERGEPVAGLLASEAPIYGRYGFGLATEMRSVSIRTDRGGFRDLELGGSVELVHPGDERAAVALAEAFAAAVAGRSGEVARQEGLVPFVLRHPDKGDDGAGPKELVISHDDDGRVDGAAMYRLKPRWSVESGYLPDGVVRADFVAAGSQRARLRLHRFLASVDLATTLELPSCDPADPTPWALVDQRSYHTTSRTDHLFVRVMDVATAFGARRYERDGRLVVEVVADDPALAGCWALEVVDGVGTCERADGTDPGLVVPPEVLGSVLLGGVRPSDLAAAQRLEVRDPVAMGTADAILTTAVPPWCSAMF